MLPEWWLSNSGQGAQREPEYSKILPIVKEWQERPLEEVYRSFGTSEQAQRYEAGSNLFQRVL